MHVLYVRHNVPRLSLGMHWCRNRTVDKSTSGVHRKIESLLAHWGNSSIRNSVTISGWAYDSCQEQRKSTKFPQLEQGSWPAHMPRETVTTFAMTARLASAHTSSPENPTTQERTVMRENMSRPIHVTFLLPRHLHLRMKENEHFAQRCAWHDHLAIAILTKERGFGFPERVYNVSGFTQVQQVRPGIRRLDMSPKRMTSI